MNLKKFGVVVFVVLKDQLTNMMMMDQFIFELIVIRLMIMLTIDFFFILCVKLFFVIYEIFICMFIYCLMHYLIEKLNYELRGVNLF